MMMKTKPDHKTLLKSLGLPILAAALLFPQAASAQADTAPVEEEGYLPKPFRPSLYDDMINNNPFEREILKPVIETVEEKPVPFNFKLIGMLKSGDSYRIAVVDAKGKSKVVTDKPDGEGFHYIEVEPSPRIQEARVHIVKGTQKEWVTFDEKRFSIPAGRPVTRTPAKNGTQRTIVPTNNRKRPSDLPKDQKTKDQDKRSGDAATAALKKARDEAIRARTESRRVVLPPPPKK